MSADSRRAHQDLVRALERLRSAERSAVILFAEILRRGWFRSLGHATMELYAREALGLSIAKTRQFLRLARALEELPATRKALAEGTLPWTKARTLVAVATPRTEARWVGEAVACTSRELEAKVAQARVRGRRERDRLRHKRGQGALVLKEPRPDHAAAVAADASPRDAPPLETPVTVALSFTPVEHARFQGLVERRRKAGDRRPRAALVLDGLAALDAAPRGLVGSPYQVKVSRCEVCNGVTVAGRSVAPAAAEAMECDGIQISADPSVPNRSSIPPAVRRAVLARDGHRCATPGCGAVHFLEVHHIAPRRSGGTHDPGNLITLCSACHRFAHERPDILPWRTAEARSTMPRP